jgi:hypothetical protein
VCACVCLRVGVCVHVRRSMCRAGPSFPVQLRLLIGSTSVIIFARSDAAATIYIVFHRPSLCGVYYYQ